MKPKRTFLTVVIIVFGAITILVVTNYRVLAHFGSDITDAPLILTAALARC